MWSEGSEGSGYDTEMYQPLIERMSKAEPMITQEKLKVQSYLKKHGMDVLAKNEILGLDPNGSLAFRLICAQCHDLPDPGSYEKIFWPQIVSRMKNNLTKRDMVGFDPEEEKEILRFLDGYPKKE